jgi:glutamate 5-kinase
VSLSSGVALRVGTVHGSLPVSNIVVIKIGSAVLAPSGELDARAVNALARDIARACEAALATTSEPLRPVIVSSGAIASGFRALGLDAPPKTIMLKQAAAAVGQARLMAAWGKAFAKHGRTTAQVLLTADDLDHRARHLNARNTLCTLLHQGVVPIINENDSVSFAEIKLGDNDRLSALVAGLVSARRLIILSTAHGLYSDFASLGAASPIVPVITSLSHARAFVTASTSGVGTGGFGAKLDAVAIAAAAGVPATIAGGAVPRVVSRLIAGEQVGTHFPPSIGRVGARKRWIALASRAKGTLTIDAGAARAILRRGASLLPSGILRVEGSFSRGATVDVREEHAAHALARGRVAYDAHEVQQIAGHRSTAIVSLLGYIYRDEVIHRDDLTVLPRAGGPPTS